MEGFVDQTKKFFTSYLEEILHHLFQRNRDYKGIQSAFEYMMTLVLDNFSVLSMTANNTLKFRAYQFAVLAGVP